jgi:hypothetical protein
MDPRTFFSVSLRGNIETLRKSIPIILNLYPNATYFLITKETDIRYFLTNLPSHDRFQVVGEDSILKYEDFLSMYNQIRSIGITKNQPERLSWYYQQALKIIFVLKSHEISQGIFPIVMFDADSIPLRKIKFFKGNRSIPYGSLTEAHSDYFKTLEILFERFDYPAMGFTTQFFTSTIEESSFLRKCLNKYADQEKGIENIVAYTVLKSTLDAHKTIDGSRFSEQELFGISNGFCSNNFKQTPIFSFRSWILNGVLSKVQLKILSLLGVAIVTYENRPRANATVLNFKQFIRVVSGDIKPQFVKFIKIYLKFL